ncbi:MAG: (2Fe-2S)-binding protein [Chloroflexi bacterium]|nr:(2Fe-2S)-binding protein [Chloroflexota bacterium]
MSNATLKVNGKEYRLSFSPHQTLLHVLREELGLVGAREGCGIGICGSCTVLVDGRTISSCLMLAVQAAGHDITTVEGLADDEKLHRVQRAFIDHFGFQCGYCTPGFILSTVALLANHTNPSAEEIREYLSGNLCRCGSYPNILKAVMSLSDSEV